jgi:DNA-binding NarL/FixJ family response regulator
VNEPHTRPAPLRVVVADDQATVRDGLVVLLDLADDIEVVGSAANGQEALSVVEQTRPDVILLDLRMPVLDGIETTRQLTERHPGVAVVVLTTYADDTSIVDALEAGARSYLTKNADRADIAQTLRSAATGLSVIDPAVRATLVKAAAARRRRPPERPRPDELPDGLTQREAEILTMIARGMANPDIAAELYLSTHTVKTHINRIFAKTRSADRAAAIRYARDHQLGKNQR